MALYFLIEEVIYTLWLLLNCHEQVWIQILPLELCSCCVYMNAACVLSLIHIWYHRWLLSLIIKEDPYANDAAQLAAYIDHSIIRRYSYGSVSYTHLQTGANRMLLC